MIPSARGSFCQINPTCPGGGAAVSGSRRPHAGEASGGQWTDLELVRGALQGDLQRRQALGTRLLLIPRLLRVISRRRGMNLAESDLEDLAQDVFITVWSKLDQFEGPEELDPWVYRICQYQLLNVRRKLWRTAQRMAPNGAEVLEEVPSQDADESSDHRLTLLESAISQLNAESREIIQLHGLEGLTFQEVARHKQVPISTVKSLYYRALERLGRSMGLPQGEWGNGGSKQTP
ncbi:MAG: sigma-70 family RNA polymerase sigma factor [Planctomycetes bacterium]|nr:sigma-70 family RNA polymerase sigma factor [Planctomycetota bacterium]